MLFAITNSWLILMLRLLIRLIIESRNILRLNVFLLRMKILLFGWGIYVLMILRIYSSHVIIILFIIEIFNDFRTYFIQISAHFTNPLILLFHITKLVHHVIYLESIFHAWRCNVVIKCFWGWLISWRRCHFKYK
jgi:hypothetical protein